MRKERRWEKVMGLDTKYLQTSFSVGHSIILPLPPCLLSDQKGAVDDLKDEQGPIVSGGGGGPLAGSQGIIMPFQPCPLLVQPALPL